MSKHFLIPVLRNQTRYIIYGLNELLHYAADIAEFDVFWWRDHFNGRLRSYPHDVVVVDYSDYYSMLDTGIRAPSKMGGEASMRFCLDAITAAKSNLITDAVVTLPSPRNRGSWRGIAIRGIRNYSLSGPTPSDMR